MTDYTQWLDRCKSVNQDSSTLIDGFLVNYAAQKDKLDREFDTRLSRYKDIITEMPPSWKGLVKSQYIAHRIFREHGLIHKYLNHAAIKTLTGKEQEYLRDVAKYPWRFSFSEITANPAPDFYEMRDAFTGEVYQLYSPAITRTLSENPVLLWFNLIAYNGCCYQTFGPVIAFRGFSADDIFFYATELNPAIESGSDLLDHIDENPVRYMILAIGSNFPLIIQQEHEMVQVASEIDIVKLNTPALRADFKIEYAESVFKLTHEEWSEPPHFAEVYFAEESGELLLFALSDQGYEKVAAILNANGIDIPAEPDIRLHVSMAHVIEKVLRKEVNINPYGHLFESQKSPESEAEISRLNQLLALALPYFNSGQEPDLVALAKQVGVDPEQAKELLEHARGSINKLRN